MSKLEKELFTSLINHSKLIQAGIPNEQALRIAFPPAVAKKTIEDIKLLTLKTQQKWKQKTI